MKKYILYLALLACPWLNGQITIGADTLELDSFDRGGASGPLITNHTKLVYWIHGLAGNYNSWSQVQVATEFRSPTSTLAGYPVRDVMGLTVDYSNREHMDLFQIGHDLTVNDIEPWRFGVQRRSQLPWYNNFYIAHSQGGLVVRAIRYNNVMSPSSDPRQAGPYLATFGTPHKGAYLVNSSAPGLGNVQAWITDGCVNFSKAHLNQFVNSKWWLQGIIPPSAVQGFSTTMCDGFNQTVLPLLIDKIRRDVADDYAVGAPELNVLRAFAPADSLQVIEFYGVEEEPVLWRTLHSMTNTTDTTTLLSLLHRDPFALEYDDGFPDDMSTLTNSYKFLEIHYKDLSRNTLRWWRKNDYWQYGMDYHYAHKWIERSNMKWKRFIGARRDSVFIGDYKCTCQGEEPYYVTDPDDCVDDVEDPCKVEQDVRVYQIDEPSDGIVPVSSQTGYPGGNHQRMENTNHMQMRNVPETKNGLVWLFDGTRYPHFKLRRK